MKYLHAQHNGSYSLAYINDSHRYRCGKTELSINITGAGVTPAQFADILTGDQASNDKSS